MKTITIIGLILLISSLNAQQIRAFSFSDISGNEQSYVDLKGEQLTVIDFWTSYCKPCFKAMPYLETLHEEYRERGVSFVGINSDGPRSTAKVAPLCKAFGISYPILKDINAELMKEYNVSILPTLLFIGANDSIVAVHEGFAGNDAEVIRAIIDSYLHKTGSEGVQTKLQPE